MYMCKETNTWVKALSPDRLAQYRENRWGNIYTRQRCRPWAAGDVRQCCGAHKTAARVVERCVDVVGRKERGKKAGVMV